jgi:Flp pilus assembly protein TadD
MSPRPTKLRAAWLHAALVALACALLRVAPDAAAQRETEQLWRARNFGKALFETPSTVAQAPAELKKAVDLVPDSFRDRLNYGIALLRAGKAEAAAVELLTAQKQDPKSPYTWFNLGIAYKRLRRVPDAIRQFERMVELTPEEPVAHYNLGYLYQQADHLGDGLREFETAARLDAKLVAPRFAIYNHYRLNGDEQQAARALAVFQQAKQAQEAGGLAQDMEWCAWAELLDPAPPAAAAPAPASSGDPARDKRVPLAGGAVQGAVALDSRGEGRADLLAWSRDAILLFRHGTEAVRDTGLAGVRDVLAVAAGDFDNDGLPDLCVLTGAGPALYRNVRGRFEKVAAALPKGRYTHAVWLDFDHDYDLDLFLFGEGSSLLRNTPAGFEDYTSRFPFAAGAVTNAFAIRTVPDTRGIDLAVSYASGNSVLYRDRLLGEFAAERLGEMPRAPEIEADFDGDGRPDRVEIAGGALTLVLNRSAQAGWLTVSLTGVKNLKLAPLADVELRAGSLYEHQVYRGVPLLFDLGGRRRADTVRITWPNGLIQHVTDAPAGRPLLVKEAPRLAESCPMVYTWNGRKFEFITDVLGVAPLGASAGDGLHFPVDHDEYVRIQGRSLEPAGGHYEVRLVEELREVAYIDQVRLIAVDHAAGTEIFSNEKFKSPPFPEFRLFGVRRPVPPASARDHRGRDVLPELRASDGVYVDGFRRDATAVAEMHALTLDFGRAAADNRAVLLLDGWVDWPDGSTFRAASQSGGGLVLPYLQVKDARGEWKTAIEDMGLPAGKPKTIAVDLTGRFVSASREVRIVTNLCLYWDRIVLSEDAGAPAVRMTTVDAAVADLRLRGFSEPTIDARREQPERFEYARWTPHAPWNQTPGLYTRYGDVRELTASIDDRFVVMGSGDELRLLFPASGLPPLMRGEARDFLLFVDGWAKDGDANTAYSQSVEPLPFHGMSGYPYAAGERYPDGAAHREYRERYNTRPAMRFVSRLGGGAGR